MQRTGQEEMDIGARFFFDRQISPKANAFLLFLLCVRNFPLLTRNAGQGVVS